MSLRTEWTHDVTEANVYKNNYFPLLWNDLLHSRFIIMQV